MQRQIKNIFRNVFASVLATLARSVVRKYKPIVIMVTGSVGKTSTKDAVAAALAHTFFIRKSDKSQNSEFGVPFTILGVENPWANPFAWMKIFLEALALILLPNHYPKLLVLEVGADHPGDLAKILKIAKPDAVIVTLLPSVPVHVEAYATPAAVREEEFEPAHALASGAPLIYCADDIFASVYAKSIDAQLCTFGVSREATVRIEDASVWVEEENVLPKGMRAKLVIMDREYDLTVPGVLGRSQLYAPAAAIATAITLGMTPEEALKGLTDYLPPYGRGRLFKGKKETMLIDDTYNSSPAAVEEILRSLELVQSASSSNTMHRRIAVLGDMLELGRYSVAEHERIGHINVLITVGKRARAIADAARVDGMSDDSIYQFDTAIEAVVTLENLLQEGDVVLVKGSQGMRMERIVRPLLANIGDAKYLVRQNAEWLRL
jgi:UDP-N-acetylmuramoyl-tripeptide--D-alanyl-D-alanine ligase